jgi:hypothetical protein
MKIARIWKETVMASLKLMSGHLLGGTEENGVILRIVSVQAEI